MSQAIVRNSPKYEVLKILYKTATDYTNGSYTNYWIDNILRTVLRVTVFQSNTETNAKNFTFDAYTADGTNINTQLSISHNVTKILEIDPANTAEFVVNNFDAYTNPPPMKLRYFRVSQDTADGTAQVIRIQVVYLE